MTALLMALAMALPLFHAPLLPHPHQPPCAVRNVCR